MPKLINAIDYYNTIAKAYDVIMTNNKGEIVRAQISDYFRNIANIQKIIDFGAGTGSDIEWQLDSGYNIIFFEPSTEMAKIAQKKINTEASLQIKTIIGDDARIENLMQFSNDQVDAIFSNFAVLNSISNLEALFSVFESILAKNKHLVCVLYNEFNWWQKIKASIFFYFPSILSVRRTLVSNDSSHAMSVHLHSRKSVIKCARKNQLLLHKEINLPSAGLILYHFIKK